jgi:hypothetical protein
MAEGGFRMSNARELIKSAIDSVPDLTGYSFEPKNKRAGVAWPVLREVWREGTYVAPYTPQYDVFAILPSTTAEESALAVEEIAAPLIEALERIGEWGQPAETVQVDLGNNNTLPALRVRITPNPDLVEEA